MALQDLCITAARRYFDYLTQERKGLIAIPIRNKAAVGADLWQLKVTRRLYDVDAIAIQVRGQSYGAHEGGHFAVDSYDEETGVLLIKLRREIPGFEEALDDEIQVISNLRFLVERIRKWFVANGHECCLPIQTEEQAPPSPLDLSEQQTAAYEAALKSGCCYIWGPPGTGKTRYVLASAVIARLLQGRRVAILAPTNLALDLAFSSMIEAFEGLAACGRAASADGETPGRHSFLRLGVPSRKFADAFPEVCEERGLRHPDYADMVFNGVTPGQAWKNTRFTSVELGNSQVCSDLADPDGDGLPNLLEYAFNRQPKQSEQSPAVSSSFASVSSTSYIYLSFPRNRNATDVVLSCECSTNLKSWNPVSAEIVSSTITNFETEQLTIRVPTTTAPYFVRLRATK